MRERVLFACALASVILADVVGYPAATLGADPPVLVQPPPKRVAHGAADYNGVVAAVGPDWFDLAPGWEGEIVGKKMQLDHKKPRRIPVGGTRVGGSPQGEGRPLTYRLADLAVGDVVTVETSITIGGEEFCLEVIINKRPGGKIPPLPDDPFTGTKDAFHLQYQAYQDWEEKGVPIPTKYLSKGRAPWTNPPYPPVAPQPREKR